MNLSDDPMTDDPLQIDRLVDGELDPDERRALLVRFETEPGGWRRCALAFLEAQSWSEAMAPLVARAASGGSPRTSTAPGPGFARRWRPMAAVAAGWLSAFALGWIAGGGASTSRPRPAPGAPLVATHGASTDESRPGPPETRPERTESASAEPTAPGRPPTLAVIPVLGADRLRQVPPPLTEPFRRDLERRGFEVEPRRGLASVKLKDGRRVVVPVDAVRVRYVGNRTL